MLITLEKKTFTMPNSAKLLKSLSFLDEKKERQKKDEEQKTFPLAVIPCNGSIMSKKNGDLFQVQRYFHLCIIKH
jgi:hypothetical protein